MLDADLVKQLYTSNSLVFVKYPQAATVEFSFLLNHWSPLFKISVYTQNTFKQDEQYGNAAKYLDFGLNIF